MEDIINSVSAKVKEKHGDYPYIFLCRSLYSYGSLARFSAFGEQ